MKSGTFILSVALLFFVACKKDNVPDAVIDNPPPPVDTTVATTLYTGVFGNGPYGTTSGMARVISINGKLQLRIENFNVSSGPDLKVYLSKERQPLTFYNLGSLKALSGDQVYDIPGNPDFMEYGYALIHCEKFNHLFGAALLMKK